MEKEIDIIIPTYKARDTLFRALSSIVIQDVADTVLVTIVNDACPFGSYQDIIDKFEGQLDIQEIILEDNVGPGDARQIGMDQTTNPYVVFMDADDQFSNIGGLLSLKEELDAHPDAIMALGRIAHEINPCQWIEIGANNSTWVFGKMFRRSAINTYNARFKPGSRACEDIGFSTILTLAATPDNNMRRISDQFIYLWCHNKFSLTRSQNHAFQYEQGGIGWAENITYAYKHAIEHGFDMEKSMLYSYIGNWCTTAYIIYNNIYANRPDCLLKTWEAFRELYNTCVLPYVDDIPTHLWQQAYAHTIGQSCIDGIIALEGTTLSIGFVQFMMALHLQVGFLDIEALTGIKCNENLNES